MKSLFEQLGGTYRRAGDYFIPDLELASEDEKPIGIWDQRREWWLESNHWTLRSFNLHFITLCGFSDSTKMITLQLRI